jgi:predicted hotdog family 3-hydroxylacyl-ACP dehydratase
MAQAVAAHDGLEAKEKGKAGERIGFLISVRKARFLVDFFCLFQTLRISVFHLWGEGESDFFTFRGEVREAGTDALLAEAQLNFYRPENLDAFKDKSAS